MTQQLVNHKIVQPHHNHFILYEKPFGFDLASARELNANILSLLPEYQVYRVDHYVAKCLTQRLPSLQYLWKDTSNIESVSVIMHEKIGIEGRGQFYDRYGAIKDVVQNHMLQLLAFFATDLQCLQKKEDVSHKKAMFLRSLVIRDVKRAQYDGYKEEKGVSPDSTTETYAKIVLESNDPPWKDVIFTLETGKCLPEKRTEIRVHFKSKGKLIIQFSPHESIILQVGGTIQSIASEEMCPDAYQMLLSDVFSGNLRYSVSFQELESQWELTDNTIVYP